MLDIINHDGRIRELQLARPPVNALNPEMIDTLLEAVRLAQNDETRALVLSGGPGLFSAGLDVPELLGLDRDGMKRFWSSLFGLLEALARSPIPVATAITGHSPAGGTVIALFSDYRIQARGDFKLGLNEVQVGLVVPPVIHQALVRLIGPYPAERHLVAGQMISAEQALADGLVDELQEPDHVIGRAIDWCRAQLALPQHAMLATRQLCRADLGALFDDPKALDTNTFADFWFREDTQITLKAMVEKLRQKRK
ncbi:MAG: enoyl-CoA hydratase/isomerase family protein [Wenzhouxiangellaceae bacterium]|nr:enoyl-CoA hydratase/isomerase family protein [Wenzhouxiangellaceae bacterium]